MLLTPAEIIHWQFRRRFFGYAAREVKEFLQRVSETLAQLMEENRTLKEERERLLERLQLYQAIEQQLQNALLVAEKTAEELKQQARREAEFIVAEARREAQQLKEEAQRQVEAMLDEVERLRQLRLRMMTELRHLLLSYLELLEKPFNDSLVLPKEAAGSESQERQEEPC